VCVKYVSGISSLESSSSNIDWKEEESFPQFTKSRTRVSRDRECALNLSIIDAKPSSFSPTN
jgi:hypothetical protein